METNPKYMVKNGIGASKINNNGCEDSISHPILWTLVWYCVIAVTCLVCLHLLDAKWIERSVSQPVQTNAYNEAFDYGVRCGVDALMFFVKKGQKEIDIEQVFLKAEEMRKTNKKK